MNDISNFSTGSCDIYNFWLSAINFRRSLFLKNQKLEILEKNTFFCKFCLGMFFACLFFIAIRCMNINIFRGGHFLKVFFQDQWNWFASDGPNLCRLSKAQAESSIIQDCWTLMIPNIFFVWKCLKCYWLGLWFPNHSDRLGFISVNLTFPSSVINIC